MQSPVRCCGHLPMVPTLKSWEIAWTPDPSSGSVSHFNPALFTRNLDCRRWWSERPLSPDDCLVFIDILNGLGSAFKSDTYFAYIPINISSVLSRVDWSVEERDELGLEKLVSPSHRYVDRVLISMNSSANGETKLLRWCRNPGWHTFCDKYTSDAVGE